ncbi:MAG TPA: kelch repeat-containing protein, partial [Gemmataceae bacterium]|nr:kelch repeat-containing protein [Gemmataceae bacterium]
MFAKYLMKATKFLRSMSNQPVRRRRPAWRGLVLETLELRDLPAPLTWAAGINLPTEGGIVAQAEGTKLLVLAGPTTTSYNLSVTNPTWKASATPTVQPLDFARSSPGVGTLPNGLFVVFGGTENGFAMAGVTQYDPNTVTVPDGVTNQTRSLRSMNNPRTLLGWATDTSNLSYAIGGVDNNGTPLASVETYNPTSNSWTYVAALPQALYSESAVSDGAGHIYTFGGVGANGTIINNVYRYTIATNTWDQVAPLQVGARDSAAVLASNGLIYIIGGTTTAGATATVESYNISTNTWNLETSLPQAVSSEAAVADSLGRIEVLGGYDANGNPLATTYISQEFAQPDLAPTITSTAPTTAGTAGYTYQVLSTGSPQPSYSLTAGPAGMTISSTTGLITWSPSLAQVGGPYTVTVQASNYAGQTTQTYNVTVKQSPPTVPTGVYESSSTVDSFTLTWNPSTDPLGIDHYNIYHYYGTGHSGRGGGITYHYDLVGTSTTNSFTLGGLLSGASAWYTIKAVDSTGLSSGYSSIYTGTTLPDRVPPVLTLPSNQTVTATDPSGVTDPGAFTATATDPGPGIDSIRLVYEVGPNQIPTTYVFPIGTTTVTAFAEDMYGNYTYASFTVQVVLFP